MTDVVEIDVQDAAENGKKGSEDTAQERLEKQTLDTLRKLGGGRVTEEEIKRGKHFVIPETMTVDEAATFLKKFSKQSETPYSFSRVFFRRPWDVAAALDRAIKVLTGVESIGVGRYSFFGSTPPAMISIKVGPGSTDTLKVPWGDIVIPMLNAEATLHSHYNDELGPLGAISISAPKKYSTEVEGLFNLVDDELKNSSIYRGKVITAAMEPDFLDLSRLNSNEIIYSQAVEHAFNKQVVTSIKHRAKLQKLGEPLKRTVLAVGDFGTGKSSMMMRAAQIAEKAGWTTIVVRPGQDDPYDALKTARLYADEEHGVLVLIEDVDVMSAESGPEVLSRLLDAFDGVETKGAPITTILTTNRSTSIPKGMLRPGRLDAVLKLEGLDGLGVLKLIRAVVGEENLSEELLNWDRDNVTAEVLAEHSKDMPPAFVREAIGRAIRNAVIREDDRTGDGFYLELDDFLLELDSLQPQLRMMQEAEMEHKPEPLASALSRVVQHGVENADVDWDIAPASNATGIEIHNKHTDRPVPDKA